MPSGFFDSDADGKFLLADLTGETDMWFDVDPDDASGVVLRATEADPNFPSEADVRDATVYGYADEYTGTYIGDVPTPPTLVCADQKDGGTVIATVSGSDAGTQNDIYTAPFGQAGPGAWTLRGTVTGDASLTFTLPIGLYVSKVISRPAP